MDVHKQHIDVKVHIQILYVRGSVGLRFYKGATRWSRVPNFRAKSEMFFFHWSLIAGLENSWEKNRS